MKNALNPILSLNDEQLLKLRSEVVLDSCFMSDYSNSFGIAPEEVAAFFDSYVSYLKDLAAEVGDNNVCPSDIEEVLDNRDNLINFRYCFDC